MSSAATLRYWAAPFERRSSLEEVEERAVPQLRPQALLVEVCECGEEVGQRVVLAPEERGQVLGEGACGGHTDSVARESGASCNARIRQLA
jgi:hypothetical protein